ncbi:ABC transporter substrate-binding protein [Photobacterium galatheae]|uniref:ABC transporter substrate-binding protein n=1 Tax=Photobacterium galatheae TaxID=1654360 RepID=A0A066RQC6_9GAMM|nr:ABC transporter substrate-binding protein [Photobacterium galatheae]KDM92564.1 hypothetical protein EA58_05560 [Photobacterium galatheae]MCM0147609.1 ABC transporter substrate-binding protein [Photobacterium galatheae]
MLFRQFILLILLSGTAFAGDREQLVILTTDNPALLSPSIERFQQHYPTLDVQILQRREADGLALLAAPDHNVDVVFSSSIRLFSPLTERKALLPVASLTQDRHPMDTEHVAVLGYSGCGMIWNQRYLDRHQLPQPERWEALTDPLYYNHLVMSSPSRSTTTHQMVENLLQRHGWDQGWGLLLQVGGNLNQVSASSEKVSHMIASGQAGIGLVIDSDAKAQQNLFSFVQFRYQPDSFILPGYIAALSPGSPSPNGKDFVQFMLTESAQKQITQAPMYKRRRHEPLLFDGTTFPLDQKLLHQRAILVQQLFDISISKQLPLLNQAWHMIHEVRQLPDLDPHQAAQLARAVTLASTPVVRHEQASQPRYLSLQDPSRHPVSAQQVERLQNEMSRQLQESIQLSQAVLLSLKQVQ